MLALNPAELIQVKKQGGAIPGADLRRFILDYTRGSISNETMTDLLTVIYNNWMTSEETFTLTESMLDSVKEWISHFWIIMSQTNIVREVLGTKFLLYLAHLWLLQVWPSQ